MGPRREKSRDFLRGCVVRVLGGGRSRALLTWERELGLGDWERIHGRWQRKAGLRARMRLLRASTWAKWTGLDGIGL